MFGPMLQSDPWTFHFQTITHIQKNQTPSLISLPLVEIVTKEGMKRLLYKQGLGSLRDLQMKDVIEFMNSWIEKLQKTKDGVIAAAPFGWQSKGDDGIEGFIYAGQVWTPTGSRTSTNPDPQLAAKYRPRGKLAVWEKARDLVCNQDRPALNALLAAGFAGPLVRFTGQSGLLMAAWSDSGTGKSTAQEVAQSIWGSTKARLALDDKPLRARYQMGQLKSLPIFWDELKTEEDTKNFVTLVFSMTGGRDRGRLNSNATMKETGEWETLLTSCSNESLLDYITSQTKMTTAGLYRIFEFVVPRVPETAKGQIGQPEAQRMTKALEENYGHVGLEYAKFLGTNHVQIAKDVAAYHDDLHIRVQGTREERFWTALVAAIVMGARYGNQLGFVTIDEVALEEFLIAKLEGMRGTRSSQHVDMADPINVSSIFAQFLNEKRATNTLRTKRLHAGRGRPTGDATNIVSDKTRVQTVQVHVGVNDKVMRVSNSALTDWLSVKKLARKQYLDALQSVFGARPIMARVGGGTEFAGPQEHMLEIDLQQANAARYLDDI